MYGQSIGIVLLDRRYPLLPGNVGNASTFDFPVRIKVLKGSWDPPFPPYRDPQGNYKPEMQNFIDLLKEFEEEGVRAITCACGFFAAAQKEAAAAVNIPVFTSPLLLVPFVHKIIRPDQKVGILTAWSPRLTDQPEIFLRPLGVDESIPLAILGLSQEGCTEFDEVTGDRRWDLDVEKLEQEMVRVAGKLVKQNPDVGALVLECSDMPPFAAAIQEAVERPVFDFIAMIDMVHRAVVQRRYEGFL